MLSFLTASGLRDLSFRTRLGWRPHTINTDSLASLHSTQLARLTLLTTFLFPFFHLFHQLPPLLAVCRGNGESDPVWLGQPSRVSRLSVDDGFLFVMSRCADPAHIRSPTDARPTKPTTRCLRSGGGSLSRGQHAQLGSTRRARRHAGSAPKVRE